MLHLKWLLFIETVLCLMTLCLTENDKIWGLLISCGQHYLDHSENSDVLRAYQLLKSNGVPETNIVTVVNDFSFDSRNPIPGVLLAQQDGPNLLDGATIDYATKNISKKTIYDVLAGNQNDILIGSRKVINSRGTDTIVIIISAVYGYNRNSIYLNSYNMLDTGKIFNIVKNLKQEKRVKKVFMILDGSRAKVTFDEKAAKEAGVFVFTANGNTGYYEECNYDNTMRSYHTGCFSDAYLSYLEHIAPKKLKDQKEHNMFDLYDAVQSSRRYNITTAEIYGDLEEGKTPLYQVFGYQS